MSILTGWTFTNWILLIKDHFILVDLQAKSQTSIDVTDRDLLDKAGFRPVDRHEIVKEKSVEELHAQLVSLVGENGAEMLISAFRSRKSISGPQLSWCKLITTYPASSGPDILFLLLKALISISAPLSTSLFWNTPQHSFHPSTKYVYYLTSKCKVCKLSISANMLYLQNNVKYSCS